MVRAALFLVLVCAAGAQKESSVPEDLATNAELQARLDEVTAEFNRFKTEVARRRAKASAEEAAAKDTANARGLAADPTVDDIKGALDHMWLLLCGALVMFMQAGFALLEAGACRVKNVQNILMKNMADVCIGTICWWAFGWMFAYGPIEGETKFAGNTQYFGHGFMTEPDAGTIVSSDAPLNWFFQWAFCSAAATIVSGGIAERVNFPSYLVYTMWMTTIIYPCVVAWTWSGSGWLEAGGKQGINAVGYVDFAGSGIVHMCGGVGALTAAIIVGPRCGRWDPAKAEEFDPHSLPLVVLGTFILWFGWYGFNCGSTLGMSTTEQGRLAASVAMNTTISAATAGLTVLGLRYRFYKKYDVGGMCNGILAGLVSITASCASVECGSACAIGFDGALLYQGASMLVRKLKIDDPLDAFAVHGAAGAWGALAVALLDWGNGIDIFHGRNGFHCTKDPHFPNSCMQGARGQAFAASAVGIVVIAAWSSMLSAAVLLPLKMAKLLRADDQVQEEGLDNAKHSPKKGYEVGPSTIGKASADKEEDSDGGGADVVDV